MIKLVKESLNENLKQELISKLLDTVYKSNDPGKFKSNREYLNLFSENELDKMLGDYYLYDIKREYK